MRWVRTEYVGCTPSGKTGIWRVFSKETNMPLGLIKWHSPWRKYCLFPSAGTIFEQDCLRDIAAHLDELKKRHSTAVYSAGAYSCPVADDCF